METLTAPKRHRPADRSGSAKVEASAPAQTSAFASSDLERAAQIYRAYGGLVRRDVLARLLSRGCDDPTARLARWIVAHDVVAFRRNGALVLPLFQFDLAEARVLPAVRAACRELSTASGDDAVAVWFTRPSGWLLGESPLERIASDPCGVVEAALADRSIADER